MERLIKLFLGGSLLLFLGCSSGVKLEQPDTFKKFEVKDIGLGRSIVVAKVFNYSNTDIINEQIAESVLISELFLADFDVMERKNFKFIVDEHTFADNTAIRKLSSEFTGADFVAVTTLSKVNVYSDTDLYIIYNNFKTICEIRVDIKIINTQTGKITSSFGEGKASMDEKNFLLILGQHNTNSVGLYEDAYRLALRQAISRIKTY